MSPIFWEIPGKTAVLPYLPLVAHLNTNEDANSSSGLSDEADLGSDCGQFSGMYFFNFYIALNKQESSF